MKNIFSVLMVGAALLPARVSAQTAGPVPDLLSGAAALGFTAPGGELPAVALPGTPVRDFRPAASAAARGTVLLLDPRTGKVQPVIQTGGGFIIAATGQFVPAVFNGSGYILQSGQYMPVVGGRAANPDNSLTGKWTGWGEWTYQGSGTHCDVMWLAFDDGKDYLERKDGYFDCGFVGLASEPARWTKKGTQLLDQNGAEAGSYEKGNVVLKEAYSENVDILTTIKVSGLHFDYSEIWTEKSGRELYVITGRMFTGGQK